MDRDTTMRSAYDRINDGDIDGFGALISDDFVEHEDSGGFPATKAGVLDFFRMMRSAFPDMHMAVEDVIVGGDKAVARVRPPARTRVSSWGCRQPARPSTSS